MKYSDFKQPLTPGRLEPTVFMERGFGERGRDSRKVSGFGYVPFDLPAGVLSKDIAHDVQDVLLAAERNLSMLEGLACNLDNPTLLMGPFTQREAKHSSAIENTFASAHQLALFEMDPNAIEPDSRSEVREVNNYVRALRYGFEAREPICLRLIRDMHRILLDGVTRTAGQPGEFRTTQNAIGDPTAPFENAKFVPPPPRFLPGCLDSLERYIHDRSDLPPLVRFALVHYQFESIHPFDDGNGRLGRLLIALQLSKQAQLSLPLVYISSFLEQHRDDYYRLLYRVSAEGAWVDWIRFFLSAISTQAHDALLRARKLIALRNDYQRQVQVKRASAMLPRIVDELFVNPAITVARVCEVTGMHPPSAGKLVRVLEQKGIVKEATGRNINRVFIAEEIVDVTNRTLDVPMQQEQQ